MLLQETHSSSNLEQIWQAEWGGDIIHNHGASNARGVAVLIRKGFDCKITKTFKDLDGRILIFETIIDNMTFTIANCYAPNSDDPDFFMNVFANIEKFQNNNKHNEGRFQYNTDGKR